MSGVMNILSDNGGWETGEKEGSSGKGEGCNRNLMAPGCTLGVKCHYICSRGGFVT